MPMMNCPPGACLWTSDAVLYQDDGSGTMEVADGHHVEEAVAAGWSKVVTLYESLEPPIRRDRKSRKSSELDQEVQ